MNLNDIVHRQIPPAPWAEGDNIPWDEPGFSGRMLREHLSQEHDLASRRAGRIARHVEWIDQHLLNCKPTRILDLGCGPGLYMNALARRNHSGIGIDFSPASIEYARARAEEEHLPCEFQLEDLRTADYLTGFGLLMLIYGEANVFRPDDLVSILQKAYRSLDSNGILLIEVHTWEAVRRIGEANPGWYSANEGLFSAEPHVVLQESYWDPDACTATRRYYVLDVADGSVSRFAQTFQAYTDREYAALLSRCGFDRLELYPSLMGEPDIDQSSLQVIVARKAAYAVDSQDS